MDVDKISLFRSLYNFLYGKQISIQFLLLSVYILYIFEIYSTHYNYTKQFLMDRIDCLWISRNEYPKILIYNLNKNYHKIMNIHGNLKQYTLNLKPSYT